MRSLLFLATPLVPFAAAVCQQGEDLVSPRPVPSTTSAPTSQVLQGPDSLDRIGTPIPSGEAAFAGSRIPVHTAEADPDGGLYGIWAAGADYKVSFHEGFTFIPYLGFGYPHNQPLHWKTVRATVGGSPVGDVGAVPRHDFTEFRYEYHHGDLVEAYDIRSEGVEQTFTLKRHPGVTGDFVVVGSISTPMSAKQEDARHGEIIFRDTNGHAIVHYGAAFVLDARGEKQPIQTRFDGVNLELRVPAAFMASAEYPVTIDPLLTRNQIAFWNTSPVTAVGTVQEVAIGRDDNFNQPMVAYNRAASATDTDLWAYIFSDDTLTLGVRNAIFTDLSTSWGNSSLSIACVDGTADKWILAFIRDNVGGAGVNGARFHPHDLNDLTVKTNVTAISRPAGSSQNRIVVGGNAAFTSNNNAFIVVERVDPGSNADVFGYVLDASTNTLGTQTTLRTPATGTSYTRLFPRINQQSAGGTDGWVVVWQDYWDARGGPDDWDVVGVRINQSGAVVGNLWVPLNAVPDTTHKLSPIVAGQNGRYAILMTVWTETPLTKTLSPLGGITQVHRIEWPVTQASATNVGFCESIHSGFVTDRRWHVDSLAYDNNSQSHWCAVMRSVTSGTMYVSMVGHDGGLTERATIGAPAAGQSNVAGAVFYDDDAGFPRGEFQLVYATNEGSAAGGVAAHPVYTNKMTHLAEPAPVLYGTGCGSGVISRTGRSLAGYDSLGIRLGSAPANRPAVLFFSTNSANVPLTGIGMTGCALNVSSAGLVQLSTVTSASGVAQFTFALPACPVAVRGSLYWQYAYLNPGSNPLGIQATRGMRVDIQ